MDDAVAEFGAVVTIAVEGILKKALSKTAREVARAWGYHGNLTTLHAALESIRAKLRDAVKQKGQEKAVMLWLQELKGVVGEADELLDEVQYQMLRRQLKARDSRTRKVPHLPSLKSSYFRRDVGRKMDIISDKLSKINKTELNNEQNSDDVPRACLSMRTEFKIFGREKDEEYIIGLLTESRQEYKLKIVPIVGMCGIGKTTLAKSIYNNPRIEKHYDVRNWLCVSVKGDVNALLTKICESLTKSKFEVPTRDRLIKSLQEKLGSKRYLLVLDDVWDEKRSHWADFRSCMLKVTSLNGSGILVTTRKLEIGTKTMAKNSWVLEGLSDDQCWSMFKERAFVAGRSPLPEMEEIGREIVKKCGGLPLLVDVIGNMLGRYNDDKGKWTSIKDSKVCDLEDVKDIVLKSLKRSFDDLPNSNVKQCFAYCLIYKKDELVRREDLIQLWMALGLVEAGNKEMEDVGNEIYQSLVNNFLLQHIIKDKYGGDVDGCTMNGLVYDLSLSLFRHESLHLVGLKSDEPIPPVEHLSVYHDQGDYRPDKLSFGKMVSMFPKECTTARTLHTLFFNGEVEKNISFQSFQCLRILKLARCVVEELTDSIGELVHLRYLDLSRSFIKLLPKSIGNLYQLQTLKLSECLFLKELPQEARNLISLRHLVIDGDVILIPKLRQLSSLQTLSFFTVGEEKGFQIEELGHLKSLCGKLCICGLDKVTCKEDAPKADLVGKKNLYEIEFRWSNSYRSGNINDKDVLEGLQPPPNVKSLLIRNFPGDNFPRWAMKMETNIEGGWVALRKLVKITLSGCRNCSNLPMLDNLPHLQYLVLEYMYNLTCLRGYSGQEDDITRSRKPLLPSLRSLQLKFMLRLEKWIDGATNSLTMLSPVLETLYIAHCPKIISFEERNLHPLVSLEIINCENLKSISSLQGLTSLQHLTIYSCPSLAEISDLRNQSRSLKKVCIGNCDKLTSLPCGFDCLDLLNEVELGPLSKEIDSFPSLQGMEKLSNNLHSLSLWGWDHWESIPPEIKHLRAVTSLTIRNFGIRKLPIWLTDMSSIRKLEFYECWWLNADTVRSQAPKEANIVKLNREAVIGRKVELPL